MTKQTADMASLLDEDFINASKAQLEKDVQKVNSFNLFPKIEVQHGIKEPKFEFGDKTSALEFLGTVVSYDTAKELYMNKDNPVPDCVSMGGLHGNAFGPCKECRYGVWIDNKRPPCKEYRRALIAVVGKPGLFEVKIAPTSLTTFDNAMANMLKIAKCAINFGILNWTLSVEERKGIKPWSVIHGAFVKNMAAILQAMSEAAKNNIVLPATSMLSADEMVHFKNCKESFMKFKDYFVKSPVTAGSGAPAQHLSADETNAEVVSSIPGAPKMAGKVQETTGDEVPF
jgi:hypothetical protein